MRRRLLRVVRQGLLATALVCGGTFVLAHLRAELFTRTEGDRLRLVTPDGVFEYRVEWLAIVDPGRTDVFASTGEPLLTLVTCYPFEYVGKAPLRYVVRARSVEPAA